MKWFPGPEFLFQSSGRTFWISSNLDLWSAAALQLHHNIFLSSFATSRSNSVCQWLRELELLLLCWMCASCFAGASAMAGELKLKIAEAVT